MASIWGETWLLALDWAIRLIALFWIPARTTSGAARSWLLLIGFLPLVGFPLYLAFGYPWLSRLRVYRQNQASQLIRAQQHALHNLRWTPTKDSMATTIARLIELQGDFMPTHSNGVQLLDQYQQAICMLIADIDSALHRVHLLFYLMYDDVVGEAVVAALERASARGVQCRLLLDALGAKKGMKAFRSRLLANGVEVRALLPGGLRWQRSGRLDLRNHRKVAVIDHRVGYIGSQNLASASFIPHYPNRELVARVSGPVVNHLQAVFASDWFVETGEQLAVGPDATVSCENVVTQLLPSGPAYPSKNVHDAINTMISLAKHRVVLATPYFIPDEATLGALRIAAMSGVIVQLILSEHNNQWLAAWAQEAYFEELLRAGVKIALYRPHFLHAKHLNVDNKIVLLGSMNLDIRSFSLNAEIGMLIYGRGVAEQMARIEEDYLMQAREINLAEWNQRPAWRKSREGIARLADALM